MEELDLLGENALRAQLPEHREAGFISRKQEKLPLKELMRQSSSMSQFDSKDLQSPPPYPETPTCPNQTKAKPNQSYSSLQESQTKPKIEKPVSEALFTTKPNSESESKTVITSEIRLKDINLSLGDIVPHPSEQPEVLHNEGPVGLALHYSVTRPHDDVSVHVIQFTNVGKQPVSLDNLVLWKY